MRLFVTAPTGSFSVSLDASARVAELARRIELETGVPSAAQTLVCQSRLLAESDMLSDVADDMCTVQLHLALNGGGKKHKKKQYTTPKKKKRVHKKSPLAVLKYYTVKDDQVIPLRRSCPECGLGVRLAVHTKNPRTSCGKCGLILAARE